ncbi:uncharacterized protein LOC123683344 [Harmonia axyridis]|uniref:uncharacterized protein LOC123683344 n=1 Tax=Harmonia axyridis TaxID=115357 RepID=UPI001E2769B7|nr:uncharacterized protein LOC123683344 [Harmonia axyridis]
MDDMKNLFEGKYHKSGHYDHRHGYSTTDKYHRYAYREPKFDPPQYCSRYEKETYHISQSTLCLPHHGKNPSKSTLCMPYHQHKTPSKSSLCSPKKYTKPVIDSDVASLPYYIVPVLYVPHKPLYDAKQMVEPHAYKAYHCKSKSQLQKEAKRAPKLSDSKSLLNLYKNKRQKNSYDRPHVPKPDKYSFEYYDEYFRRYVEEKKSSSDISFCTEKSYCRLPLTPKLSSKFTEETSGLASERRKSISKDFPELFGLHTSKTTDFALDRRNVHEEPTWDSPRTTDAFIETEIAVKSCISAQTSFENFNWRKEARLVGTETQGTQTFLKDIKKNVLLMPKREISRGESIPEEVPKSIYEGKVLNPQFSEGQLNKRNRKSFGFNRSSPRFAVSRLTKSAVSSSYSPGKKSSRKSMDSEKTSIA